MGAWPAHYVDTVHEKDGGDDRGHRRVQDGVAVLESMFAGLGLKHDVIPVAWDDVNDMSMLNPDMVVEARKAEMEYFRKMQVYDAVPRDMIWQTQGKLIDTRWIGTNKADESSPEYRSKLVGCSPASCVALDIHGQGGDWQARERGHDERRAQRVFLRAGPPKLVH